ncbi:MAG TPA: OsmC family peroxiredoxin [Chloroflexia bacterium]|jgi:osmotically inducible protein OsmC|nr:OsmC family peroxiredoxin [Chloroflexia bacterium]
MTKAERTAQVEWKGTLREGAGTIISTGSGAFGNLPVTWAARTEASNGLTSPEELLAAAHASCFAMAFSSTLAKAGYTATELDVKAVCTFEPPKITTMHLEVHGQVPGIDQAEFARIADQAEKSGCPVSAALRNNVAVSVSATLEVPAASKR